MAVHPIEFNTERLAFRTWQDKHRAPFAAMNADAEVMRFFPALLSQEQTYAGIDIWRQQITDKGWSNWAVELLDTGEFIGFIGLSVPRRQLPFSPCVEIGWRLKRAAWGKGYATEGAKECLRVGFERLGLEEVVSFTTLTNLRSVKVMERIGMVNLNANFEHPAVPEGSPLRPHCLYKINRAQWRSPDAKPLTQAEPQRQAARPGLWRATFSTARAWRLSAGAGLARTLVPAIQIHDALATAPLRASPR